MYAKSRTVLISMLVPFALSSITVVTELAFFAKAATGKVIFSHCALGNNLNKSVTIRPMSTVPLPFCEQTNAWKFYYLFWTPLLGFELWLTSLAVYKGVQSILFRKALATNDFGTTTLDLLVRDSVGYFLV